MHGNSEVKDSRDNHEAAKEHNLNAKAEKDDGVAEVLC
jgi:hypothetical protein